MLANSSGINRGPFDGKSGIDTSLLAAYGVDDAVLDVWRMAFPRLLPIQARAVAEFGLFSGQNLLIFAPTSSGKTFVGEMAAVAAAKRNRRALYLLPLKSLAEEKFDEFDTRYGPLGLKIVVSSRDRREHDTAIEKGNFDIAIVVFEKMDSLLISKPTLLADIGLVVVDEMQMLCDISRGPRLELLLSKVLAFAKNTQIIGLSAVLERSQDIRDWIGARLLEDHHRPVELRKGVFCGGTFYYVLHNEGTEGQERFDVLPDVPMSHAVLGLVEQLVGRDEQCIVFLRDKTSTLEMARLFAEHSQLGPAEVALNELRDLSEASPSTEVLMSLLSSGVAFHNADLAYSQRRSIESGFKRGEIKAIFCTTTLGMGINLPAKNVIIDDKRWQFSKEFQQMHLVDIGKSEYENLGGRAGRLSLEPEFGRSILVTASEFEEKRLKDIYIKGAFEAAIPRLNEMPLEDIVLNLCASHIVATETELLKFLLRTYTGRNLWSKDQTPTPQAARNRFQQDVHECVERLLVDGLLTSSADVASTAAKALLDKQATMAKSANDGEAFSVSELGRLVSRSCVLVRTGVMLSKWARKNRGQMPTPLEILLLLAQTRDSRCVHVPLAHSEWQDDRYLNALKNAASTAGLLERPIVADLIDPSQRPSFEQTRAFKRALILLDWINEAPLGDIEKRYYQAWPGLVQKIGETDSWLCDSLSEICRLYNWPTATLREFSTLIKRLSSGLFDDATPLYERIHRHTTRAVARRLVDGGVTSLRKLREASYERISELAGHQVAARLRSAFHLKPPGRRASKAAELPLRQMKDQVSGTASPKAPEKTLIIDTRNLSVSFKGAEVILKPKCFKLLLALAKRAPQVVHKETIYQALWGHRHPEYYVYDRQIADHKSRLRKAFMETARRSQAISEEETQELLVTKYGVGYQLALPQESIQIIE